jgi:hypothetical protein
LYDKIKVNSPVMSRATFDRLSRTGEHMNKNPKLNIQRTTQPFRGIDKNRLYTSDEVNNLLAQQGQHLNSQIVRATHEAMKAEAAWDEVMDCQSHLREIMTRVFTKVDCLRGYELAEKLQGEIGKFTGTLNEMFAAWQRVDPKEEQQAREEAAEVINEFVEGIKAVIAGHDLQAEQLRAVAEKLISPDGRHQFRALNKRLSHSRMLPENEYIAEQAIKLKELYRGVALIGTLIDNLRAFRQRNPQSWRGSIEEKALLKLETYGATEAGRQFINQLTSDIKKR